MKAQVPFTQIAEFVEQTLGAANINEVMAVEITGDGVTITECNVDAEGHRYAFGDALATVTTTIAIDLKG